jgi:transposase
MIKKMQEQEQLCQSILSDITALAKAVPYYACLTSIPGIGDNLASRIIAELGDIDRFHNRSALVAYAGLNPKILQSGDIDGTHLKISKKGNKHLRCLLYLAASCNYRAKKYDPVYEFNKKKRQQFGSHKSKAATVATAHKLLAVIYAMCKNGTLYSF